MKEKLKKLPPPLRKQALLRFAGAGACFCLLLLVAVGYCQPMLWFPFLVVGAFSAGSGALLMWRVDQGKVLVMEGVCREVESTLFRRRPKAVVMECGDRQVKDYLHARVRNLAVGERLRFYVAESMPVYEEDDSLVLGGYLAIEVGKK